MMVGELPQNVLGTDPKYSPIVDHVWLSADAGNYDNYPSDNNPVRVLPKLSELWNPERVETGLNRVPGYESCGCAKQKMTPVPLILRTAKKAMMKGLVGSGLADHLRERYSKKELESAREELTKLSSEQGLLGNVYVDLSAFENYREANEFMTKHKNRLARYLLVKDSSIRPELVKALSLNFKKDVVSSMDYGKEVLASYKSHLITAGKIDPSYEVDSKEALKKAFLARFKDAPIEVKAAEAPMAQEDINSVLTAQAANREASNRIASTEIEFSTVRPIVAYVRELLAKGKSAGSVKNLVRAKYTPEDIKKASKYLALVASDEAYGRIGDFVESGRLSTKVASEIARIVKANPLPKIAHIQDPGREYKTIGVQAYDHTLSPTRPACTEIVKEAVDHLRKGTDIMVVRSMIASKVSASEVTQVFADAMKEFNSTGIGVKTNKIAKPVKPIIAEVKKPTLPTKEATEAQIQEIMSTFENPNEIVQIDPSAGRTGSMNIEIGPSSAGIDSAF